ncbi:hypothetical protein HDU78_003117 [Chytriomyces hyalinus]|nr:hypothetical protein HDU78_003117 [Chytriomyces hyalinus]
MDASDFDGRVQAALRPTESVVSACEVWAIRPDGGKKRRVAAIVKTDSNDTCGLVLLRYAGENNLAAVAGLPILADFTFTLAQTVSNTKARTNGLTMSVSGSGHKMTLFANSPADIQHFIHDLKAVQARTSSLKTHLDVAWLENYTDSLNKSERQAVHVSTNPFILDDFSPNPINSKTIKENWMIAKQREKEAEIVEFESLKIFTGAWNVNGYDPNQPLDKWLGADDADIFALGLQEIDLTTEIYIYGGNSKQIIWCEAIEKQLSTRESKYFRVAAKQLIGLLVVVYAKESLKSSISEVTVEAIGTGLMGLGNKGGVSCRFRVKDSYLSFVSAHLAADTSMVERRNQDYAEICKRTRFPVAAPYMNVRDYTIKNPWTSNADLNAPATSPTSPTVNTHVGLFDSDYLFFMGDLNYRIPISDTDAKAYLTASKLQELLELDQLKVEQQNQRVFVGFEEAPITFRPTYKFDVGTSDYDTSEKKRSPSWCDRILWYTNRQKDARQTWIQNLWYRSTMELTLSDHKPVSALFDAKIRAVQKEKMEVLANQLAKQLDKFENESIPTLEVKDSNISFDNVRFLVPITRSIIVQNTGKVLAHFRFIPKQDELVPCKPFYHISPSTGALLPGDAIRINITLHIRQVQTSSSLTVGTETLDDKLVLHTDLGKDSFVCLAGVWLPSCFGSSLEVLCSIQKPIRQCGLEGVRLVSVHLKQGKGRHIVDGPVSLEDSSAVSMSDAATNQRIPVELLRMVDFLFRYGLDTDKLFRSPGDPFLVRYIVECLDTGSEFDVEGLLLEEPEETEALSNQDSASQEDLQDMNSEEHISDSGQTVPLDIDLLLKSASILRRGNDSTSKILRLTHRKGRVASVHAVAECLLKFLEGLEISVVPDSLYLWIVQEGYYDADARQKIRASMPAANGVVFDYLLSFLREVLAGYTGNPEPSAESLARIFAPVMIRKPLDVDTSFLRDAGGFGVEFRAAVFIEQFLRDK